MCKINCRDIIIKAITHKMKNLILAEHYQEPLEVLGKRIKIWKELPKEIIQRRKDFKQLVEKLRQEQVCYRWEVPHGISFLYENKKVWIRTREQMQEFLLSAK